MLQAMYMTKVNTAYSKNDVIADLEKVFKVLSKWFKDNSMKASPNKYHLLINNTIESYPIKVGNKMITSRKYEKLLGTKIDQQLRFNEHVQLLCKKSSQKVNVLSRIAFSMNFEQRKLILNAFITSHFSYCPAVWMLHSRKLNDCINRIHEIVLRIVYKDYQSIFHESLSKRQIFNYPPP